MRRRPKNCPELSGAGVKQLRAEATEVTVPHTLQPVGAAPPPMHTGYSPRFE